MSLFGLFFTQLPEVCILVDPFANKIQYRNIKAQQLLLTTERATDLFCASRGKLVVFTQEVLEKQHAWSSELSIRLPNDKSLAVETLGFRVETEPGRVLIAMLLTSQPALTKKRQIDEVNRLHRGGLAAGAPLNRPFVNLSTKMT
jgi:hypothetical protein